jgi:hypothetical protein
VRRPPEGLVLDPAEAAVELVAGAHAASIVGP